MDPVTVGLIGSGIAGAANIFGGAQQQKASRKEAKRNRQFQERMRDTAWQAAVADMKAAGINPAVAYSRGPASAPSGSMAAQNDIVGQSTSSAMQAMRVKKELKLLDAQIAAASSQAMKTQSEKINQDWINLLWGSRGDVPGQTRIEPKFKGPLWLLHEANTAGAQNTALLKGLEIPMMKNLSTIAGTPAGKMGAWVQYLLKSVRGGKF